MFVIAGTDRIAACNVNVTLSNIDMPLICSLSVSLGDRCKLQFGKFGDGVILVGSEWSDVFVR